MAATDTESMHENMTRLRMRMVQQKLANEREKLQRPESQASENGNGYDDQVKLQQAMLRRQELLDKIRLEQCNEARPRTYTPRRRYTPTPLVLPPSRRSLPEINTKHYHFGVAGNGGSHRGDMAQVKHVIEHQFKPAPAAAQSYTHLPPIQPAAVPQVAAVQPLTYLSQPVAPACAEVAVVQPTYAYPTLAVKDCNNPRKDTMFNKSDFMDMMMLQNAQMHHMVMQQMMLHQLPGGPSNRPCSIPFAEPAAPVALMRPAPSVYHHHMGQQPNYSMPPMDYRGGGGNAHFFGRSYGRRPMNFRARLPFGKNAGPAVVRTDNVKKSSKPYPFPGPKGLRRLRHIAYASWFIAILRAMLKKKGGARPSSVFLFGIILKEIVAALHRIYLNPNGNMYPIMQDIIGSGAQDLSQLLYGPGPPPDDIRGRRTGGRGRGRDDPRGQMILVLQYVIENVIYHMTEIMPKTGVLGTHKKAAVFEMIKNGKRFPDGYFWQIELDRLQFDGNGRTSNVGNLEAFILLVGIFLSRSFITTLLMKPVDYGLSNDTLSDTAEKNIKILATCLLFLVRRVSVRRESPMLPMPGEVARYVFADEEMRHVHLRLRRSYEYCENLLREWGAEYIKRLRQAGNEPAK